MTDKYLDGLLIGFVVGLVVMAVFVLVVVAITGVFSNSNTTCTETVTSLGLPDMMVQQGRDYEKKVAIGTRVDVDACSFATKTDNGKWEVIIGDC